MWRCQSSETTPIPRKKVYHCRRRSRFAPERPTEKLSLEFLRVVEQTAVASARTMGVSDREAADRAAVEAMRKEMDGVGMETAPS